MFITKFLQRRIAILIVGLAIIAAFPSCQDDPELQPVVDGIPVITPKSKVYITQIQLVSYPPTDPNGDTWDIIDSANFDYEGLPDVFFNFTVPTPQPPVLWSQNSHFSDVSAIDSVYYLLLTPFEVVPFGSDIDVNVYDYELPDSTLMTTASFFVGQSSNPLEPFPPYLIWDQNGYTIAIWLKWED